jgi:sulfate adenylyltransferase
MQNNNDLIEPYGGALVDLVVPLEQREELFQQTASLPRVQLSERATCDLELLATGGFSPLKTFLGRADYERVIEEMRLDNGILFPIPVTLPISKEASVKLDAKVALVDSYNNLLALLRVDEIYNWDRAREAALVCGSNDPRHPLVAEMNTWGEICISGALEVLQLPLRYDFKKLRMEPAAVRNQLKLIGRRNVVAFQTRNPLHRAHETMTKKAVDAIDGTLLLHPVVGMTKPGDIDHYTRVRSYIALTDLYYDADRTLLALLPLAMRLAGPREAVWHAIIRRNFGANFFIVGRDHASPGLNSNGLPFYEPYSSQELLTKYTAETQVTMLPFGEFLYLSGGNRYEEAHNIPAGSPTTSLSGTEVRNSYLDLGRKLPEWFTRPEVSAILESSYPPKHRQGFCIWFTGLSCSGKTTTANIVTTRLLEHGRQVTLLDGDVVRTHLSHGLGFSKEDRDTNIRRIGYVASEVVRHGGAVICAAVSPYRATRNECRLMVGVSHFFEVFVAAPIEVCESRDTKGMYQRARAGEIKNFTGVDDPYEPPTDPEITIDAVNCSAEENAERILTYLIDEGFVLKDFVTADTTKI